MVSQGEFIAFQAGREGTRHIWIVLSDGGTPVQITKGESEDSHPFWSPINQDEILFLRDHQVLCVVSVSTGEVQQIMDPMPGVVNLDYPSWSFDGEKIYFSVSRKTGDIYLLENY